MKKYIFTLIVLITVTCKAQSPIISMVDFENNDDLELTDGCYLKDVENKFLPFIGTWEWTDGSNTFTVVIEKLELVFEPHTNTYSDYLIGKYRYVENGVEIVSTLNNVVNASNMWVDANVLMYNGGYDSDTKSLFRFFDYIKQKRCYLRMTLTEYLDDLEGNIYATKAQWELYDEEKSHITPVDANSVGFSVPQDVELVKQ